MFFSSHAQARVISPCIIAGVVEEVGVVVESAGVMCSSEHVVENDAEELV
jgi:hypothetical protein